MVISSAAEHLRERVDAQSDGDEHDGRAQQIRDRAVLYVPIRSRRLTANSRNTAINGSSNPLAAWAIRIVASGLLLPEAAITVPVTKTNIQMPRNRHDFNAGGQPKAPQMA